MQKISQVGGLLKKIYRIYSNQILSDLQDQGFLDLRPSFLEILNYVCDNQASSIKEIGFACGLKKQTMTSHLNELEKRGYITRVTSQRDRREQVVQLTAYGEKFKLALIKTLNSVENDYLHLIGEVELDRIILNLENFHTKLNQMGEGDSAQQMLI